LAKAWLQRPSRDEKRMINKENRLLSYEYRLEDRFIWLMLTLLIASTCYFMNLTFYIALLFMMPLLSVWFVLDRKKISFQDDCVIILGNRISKEDLTIKYESINHIEVKHLDAFESKSTRTILTIHLDENIKNRKHNLSINSYVEAGHLIRFLKHKGVDIQFDDMSFKKYVLKDE
jgi:hypothetical protein